jgi:hypothetical protein
MRLLTASLLVFGIFEAGTSIAATAPNTALFKNISGKVLVNTGDGYASASPAMKLKAGDTVMLGENATASIYFPSAKCAAVLPKASVTTITGADMCQQAMAPAGDGPIITPANSGPPPVGEIPPLFIAGGIVVLSAAALIDGFSHNSKPLSGP